jgi:hypothetical protein
MKPDTYENPNIQKLNVILNDYTKKAETIFGCLIIDEQITPSFYTCTSSLPSSILNGNPNMFTIGKIIKYTDTIRSFAPKKNVKFYSYSTKLNQSRFENIQIRIDAIKSILDSFLMSNDTRGKSYEFKIWMSKFSISKMKKIFFDNAIIYELSSILSIRYQATIVLKLQLVEHLCEAEIKITNLIISYSHKRIQGKFPLVRTKLRKSLDFESYYTSGMVIPNFTFRGSHPYPFVEFNYRLEKINQQIFGIRKELHSIEQSNIEERN